jgi:hypothetical protein
MAQGEGVASNCEAWIRCGSGTYASAVIFAYGFNSMSAVDAIGNITMSAIAYLNCGETIHLGGACSSSSATRKIRDDNALSTAFTFYRID